MLFADYNPEGLTAVFQDIYPMRQLFRTNEDCLIHRHLTQDEILIFNEIVFNTAILSATLIVVLWLVLINCSEMQHMWMDRQIDRPM